ncbi:MAG: HAMP domain-containing histidine kinase [Casimicrobiaceae bacterium]|nr:HAMP domain-containing histidine kinase [Casimicrobiaceae bacterium]MDW8311514.1 ATP-binding protein [Burkholderiales bacterium]
MYYPRSLTNVILACFVVSAVPLVVALAELAIGLDALAKRSQLAVREAEAAGAASRELRDLPARMERAIRQALVLEDLSLIEGYRKLDQQLEATLLRAQSLPIREDERAALRALAEQRRALAALLPNSALSEAQRLELAQRAADLTDASAQVATQLTRVIEREVLALRELAARTREHWPWFLGGAAAIALMLAVGFSILIARPLSNIDRSIRRLGRGDFSEPIVIGGPSDLRTLGERLEWMRRRLLELESSQSRFLRHVSHELKTPLTAVREGAELLHDRVLGELSRQQIEVVRIIRDNTLSLQRLIEDLLAYQQHRSATQLRIERIDFAALVERVVREHRLDLLANEVTVKLEGVPLAFDGDRERLRIVIDNLLSNAIKYSPRGGTIHVITARLEDGVQFEVHDQGPGIALEEAERIFESFYRGAASETSKVKGTGLGLAIVREYVTAHGGRVEVVRAGEPGARFRVWLPASAQAPASVESSPASVNPGMEATRAS